ncbi:long-chain-fatty-acid--CoA ligase [Aneurinibacillus aneurinilyticus]|uniref:Long-chain-fatty-acid--CoA ligase n=2 Tax=Aneurinibacillus aneurinilyticus TaxID=1391 RepID=A0A848CR30_ANEAE|nr:long-chain-fatty-acid--CoA ligase [Aneurinibacillus aneurinilyticus]
MYMLLSDILQQYAVSQPDRTVTVFQECETSYQRMQENCQSLGGYFHRQGLVQGDVVALLLNNSDKFVTCYFACQLAGLVVLPINTRLAPPEIEYILNHSEARLLVYEQELSGMVEQLIPRVPNLQHFVHVGESGGGFELTEAIKLGGEIPKLQQQEDDTAVIFYTSGTTGKPKGVMLTHRNCVAIASIWHEALGMQQEDRVMIVTPLFHCAASHCFMLPTIYGGGTLVIEPGFHPQEAVESLQKNNVSIFFGVPAMYMILLNTTRIESMEAPHLRKFMYGAAPMPYELIRRIKQLFPQIEVQNLYGQTENSPGTSTLGDEHALSKAGSVGKPLPRTEVRIVDEEGNEVSPGQVGEISIKGNHVMKGYLKNPEATALAIRDGWLLSGDLGKFDEEGFLYIVDRKKDMIIRGGENIYPIEVEEVLYEMLEVLEAAVVGTPHEVYGEIPKACVVVKQGYSLTEEQVLEFCRERLAKYKMPALVEFVDVLPRNASGKVLKTVLRGEIKFS